MTETEDNKALVRRFFDAFNRGDSEAYVGMFTEDGRAVTMGTTPISGTYDVAAMRRNFKEILGVFSEPMRISVSRMVAEGNKVAAEGESRARNAAGVLYENRYHFVFTFRNGKVFEFKEYFDTQLAVDVLCGGKKAKE